MFEQQANLVARLALHQSQRCQSIPTLSVLMGKSVAAHQAWTAWLRDTHRQTAVDAWGSQSSLFARWLTTVEQHHDLRSLVIQKVATLVGQSAEHLAHWLANTSDYQLQLFWQQVVPLSEETTLLRSLLDALPPAELPRKQAGHTPVRWSQHEDAPAVLRSFATVTRLLPLSSIPGLFVFLPEETTQAGLRTALTTLTALAEAIPMLPLALALTGAQGQLVLDEFPESRVKAMARSGLIEVPSPKQSALGEWLCSRGVNDEARLQPILNLAERYGMTTDLLETALPLTDPAALPDSAEADTLYRSQAERFLSQYLETNPKTVGRFQVNAQLDIDFGGHKMEVDFLDADAKIVIELDGYYHFESRNAYRRDRHKDRTLQLHGFLVLRFLAEDVVSEFETIFDTIDRALAVRQPLSTNHLEA